jgi:hypothetical protein
MAVYEPGCHPQNRIWTSTPLRSIYYFVGDRPVHKLPFVPEKKPNNPLKIDDPGTHKKRGMLNVIKQLQHFILCNMMCYGAPWSILLSSAP